MSDAFQSSGGSMPPSGQQARHAEPLSESDVPGMSRHIDASGTTVPPAQQAGGPQSGHSGSAHDGSAHGTADVAKEQAANVASTGVDAGKRVAGTAKDEAKQVAQEVGSQAKQLLRTAGDELQQQAGSQQQRLAEGLRAAGKELHGMADSSSEPGIATDIVRQVGARVNDVASWLEARDPKGVLDEVGRFARRRPGTFIAIAGVAGFLLGRLGRSLVDEAKDDAEASTAGAARSSEPGAVHRPAPVAGWEAAPGYGAPPVPGAPQVGGYGQGVPGEPAFGDPLAPPRGPGAIGTPPPPHGAPPHGGPPQPGPAQGLPPRPGGEQRP